MNAQDAIDLERPAAGEADGDARVEASPIFTQAFDFLALVWGADQHGALNHVHMIAEKLPTGGFKHYPVSDVHVAIKEAFRIASVGHDAYFACAAFKTEANRTADNAAGAQGFWFDVDCGPDKAYPDKCAAAAALRDFCRSTQLPRPSIIIDSGNGLHCYWLSGEPIGKEQWREKAERLKALARAKGFKPDPNRTADIASVMRVPGTKNWKDPSNPKRVTILSASYEHDFSSFVAALEVDGLPVPVEGSAHRIRNFPPSSADKIIERCATLKHVANVRGAVSEPLWRDMLGVIRHTVEGASRCHEWSVGDPRYRPTETQQKIDRWTAGPTLCETFRASSDAKCQGCTQTCKSPIRLGWSDDVSAVDAAQHEMNLRYFVARVGGDVYVFDEQDESLLANGMSFTAFKQFKAGFVIDGCNIPNVWLSSPLRRTYDSLVFEPSGKCSAVSYNTWRGLALAPAAGECGLIVAHIRDVWCNGDTAQFHYVMRWMALMVQQPWIKPEVALVLRSKEGAGKNMIVHLLLKLFGIHGYVTAKKDQVAGRFNGHLFDKVLVVLNEAFFAGDPEAVASAKALITDSPLGYEAKGKDAFSAPNYAHVISLTNNKWAVPAGEDSRRWMVLDVSEAHKGDHPYFIALADEIEHGGTEAFLHLLLRIKLRGYNPRILPQSDALHAQQVETLTRRDAVAGWWLHVLSEGGFPTGSDQCDWDAEVPAIVLLDSYTHFTARFRGAPIWDVAARRLRALLPSGGFQKVRKGQGISRTCVYTLPDLDQARGDFKSITGVDPCAV
jgi:hypothetical protein